MEKKVEEELPHGSETILIVEGKSLRKCSPAFLLQRDQNHHLLVVPRVVRQDLPEVNFYRWFTGKQCYPGFFHYGITRILQFTTLVG